MKALGAVRVYDSFWERCFEERLATRMASTLTGRETAHILWAQHHGECLVCRQRHLRPARGVRTGLSLMGETRMSGS